ncbi:cation:dicarboxylate symporter family transporter [Pseudarthrobacter sp. H2]|uniref:potassium channel family protein n=1 Tax=Pseudarthrobacter sp. H2 TaxID=3418415 RepID=UPI003CE8C27C
MGPVPGGRSGLVVPTGYSFNLDGAAIYLSLAAVYIAQATNTELSIGQQLGLIAVMLLTSKGAAGVAGGGFIALTATLATLGTIPAAGITLIFGIDKFMSECRALVNFTGNAVATLLVYAGALAVLDAEENAAGSNITNFEDALWWAMTTITTVGYGDHFPVTLLGRLVAAGLMIGGIAVLGVVTASVAAWLVENVAVETAADVEAKEEPLRLEIARLARQIEQLSAQLPERATHEDNGSAPDLAASDKAPR